MVLSRFRSGGADLSFRDDDFSSGSIDSDLLAGGDATYWLAVRDGRVLAFHLYQPLPPRPAGLLTPDSCVELSVGVTDEASPESIWSSTTPART